VESACVAVGLSDTFDPTPTAITITTSTDDGLTVTVSLQITLTQNSESLTYATSASVYAFFHIFSFFLQLIPFKGIMMLMLLVQVLVVL
jgi:hypothetical protein